MPSKLYLEAERELSIESQKLYEEELLRDPTIKVTSEGIYIAKSGVTITAEMLSKKPIPDRAAKLLLTDQRIERQLGPYGENAFKYSTGIEGFIAWYTQWVREEFWHPLVILFVLQNSPNYLKDFNFGSDYAETTRRRFKAPYKTRRENHFYTIIQESMTNQSYMAVIKSLEEADCEIAAEALRAVALDEAYHRAGLGKLGRLEIKYHPKHVVRDALRVSGEFAMPALDLLPEPRGEMLNMYKVFKEGGFDIVEMNNSAVKSFLREVPGVTQEQINQVLLKKTA